MSGRECRRQRGVGREVLGLVAITASPCRLLGFDRNSGDCVFPLHREGRCREGDLERFHQRWGSLDGHLGAAKVARLAVFCAPLAGLLADDQGPFCGGGNSVDRVVALWNGERADLEVCFSVERSSRVGTGAPDFTKGNEAAKNLAAFDGRRGVLNGDSFAPKSGSSFSGWAGLCFLLLRGRKADSGENQRGCEKKMLHGCTSNLPCCDESDTIAA